MKKPILMFFALLFLAAQLTAHAEDYKQVKIYFNTRAELQMLARTGFDLEHAVQTKDNAVIIFVSESEYAKLQGMGFRSEVIINSWEKHYASLPGLTDAEKSAFKAESREKYGVEGFGYGSMGGYYTLAEVYAQLDTMYLRFPSLISQKVQIGTTVENRPVYMVKITKNPEVVNNRPQAFYSGLHHAREPEGMMALIYFMYYLLENYSTLPDAKYLVDNRELYFVPVINPDGYEYNHSTNATGGGMWRKNRKNNGDGSYGIDLNRNYGPYVYWNANNGGSSTLSSDDTYRGTAPFSEKETQAVRDLLGGLKIKTALNYHTYSNLLIYPYGALSRETADSLTYREYGADMVSWNGYLLGLDQQTVGYSTRGNSDDFFYDGDSSRGKILAMTPEVGSSSDGFWPAQSRIFPLAQENLKPNLYYAWVAGEYVSLKGYALNHEFINPGENVQMNLTLKNKGLSTGRNIKAQLASLSNYVTVSNGTVLFDSITARSIMNVPTPFAFSIAGNAPIQEKVKLMVSIYTGTSLMEVDTVSITLGTPSFVFRDTSSSPATMWTITASPTTPKWDAITSTFYSSPTSFTDSKDGLYSSNATVTMTLNNAVNLTGLSNPKLSFQTKWDIETKWDCGVVQITTDNGTTWTSLTGLYTKAASGSGKQIPAGMSMYDGTQANWVKEEIDLSAYVNKTIKIRFELRTDGSVTKDGWYVDDIGIYTFTAAPSVTWQSGINLKDAGNSNADMIFGLAPAATNGIDASLGEVSLPPSPPAGVFDTRFELPVTPAEYSLKDFRKDTLSSADWVIKFQPGAGGYPLTLTWNSSALPAGTFSLKDAVTGTIVNVDMKAQSSYSLTNSAINSLKIQYRKQSCANLSLSSGWNLVSVPYVASNMAPSSLFAQANSPMYFYNNGYGTAAALVNGQGYWVRYPASTTENICGNPVGSVNVPLVAGWNLIGAYAANATVSQLTTVPSGIVNSSYYGYSSGYTTATSLESGKGYWVRSSQAGQLVLPAAGVSKQPSVQTANSKEWSEITITDAQGSTAKLYASKGGIQNSSLYELPPVPPAGIFDARFASQSSVENFASGSRIIQLSSAVYPVSLRAGTGAFRIKDAFGGKILNQPLSGSEVVISDARINRIEISLENVPSSYELAQNYPNPFNPATSIRFSLPENANVKLSVYNQLGEKVTELVNAQMERGYHSVEFNASGLPSGVYFYELQAGKFHDVKKLMLMK